MEKYIKVASYNLDNSSGSLDGAIMGNEFVTTSKSHSFDRKKTLETVLEQAKLLISLDADFLLIQELTGLTPMNAFVNTKDPFLSAFQEYRHQYYPNLLQLNGYLEHGKANLAKQEYEISFVNHEISRDSDDYDEIKRRRVSFITKAVLKANAYILNNRSMIETSTKVDDKPISIFNTHLMPYPMNQEKRIWELTKIINILIEKQRQGIPVILGGDFNFSLESNTKPDSFPEHLKKLLEANGLKLMIPDKPPHRRLVKNEYGFYSLNSLDGFITSEGIDVINLGVIDNPNLSDHFPIFCKVKIK